MGVTFTSVINSILLQKPFFAVKINFDGDEGGSEVIKEAGERIRAIVVYTNNLNDRIRDAEIELKLSGEVLDKTSVSVSDGFYQSNTNTIVWNQSTNTSFDELRPRTNKETQFTFAPKPLGTKTSLIKNPEIIFDLKLTGIRVSENDVEEKIETEIIKHIKFTSDVTFDSSIYYGTGPFANTGPIPPKAEKDTEYTVTWTISNTSNNFEDGRITASLPTYVKWNNKISPDGANIIFDPQTRQITWDVGSVPAGAGYGTSPARSASFQVTLTPSISQIHSSPLLITNQLFEARDTFTNTGIEEATQDDTIRPEDLSRSLDADKVVE